MELAIIVALVVVALVFDYTNGFHDAANAIATSVSTRALTPRVALVMAAVMNFVGAFLGQQVAHTVSDVIVPGGSAGSRGFFPVAAEGILNRPKLTTRGRCCASTRRPATRTRRPKWPR